MPSKKVSARVFHYNSWGLRPSFQSDRFKHHQVPSQCLRFHSPSWNAAFWKAKRRRASPFIQALAMTSRLTARKWRLPSLLHQFPGQWWWWPNLGHQGANTVFLPFVQTYNSPYCSHQMPRSKRWNFRIEKWKTRVRFASNKTQKESSQSVPQPCQRATSQLRYQYSNMTRRT